MGCEWAQLGVGERHDPFRKLTHPGLWTERHGGTYKERWKGFEASRAEGVGRQRAVLTSGSSTGWAGKHGREPVHIAESLFGAFGLAQPVRDRAQGLW